MGQTADFYSDLCLYFPF